MRVVFDTNVVLSALVFGRRLAWLRGAWTRGVVIPVVCRETAAELLRVLAYPKFKLTPAEIDLLLAEYLPFAEVARLPQPLPALPLVCRDRDDAVFIQLALSARATCLVSGDRDLIPGGRKADWYARGAGGAAARKIKRIPAGRPSIEESILRPAGIRVLHDAAPMPTLSVDALRRRLSL